VANSDVLVALISGGFATAGIVVANRMGVSAPQRADARSLEARYRSLDDYTQQLRTALDEAHLPVPQYPPELREVKP
jgi:hypothetical protein